MPQKEVFFSLSIGLISIFPWIISPQSVFAGESIIRGSSIESSSFSNTSEVNQAPVLDGSITVESGVIRISDELQLELNKGGDDIINDSNNENETIMSLIRGDGVDVNEEQIRIAFTRVGVSSQLIDELIDVLADLVSEPEFVNINQPNSDIPKTWVNVNKLSTAIKIYNQIVQRSDTDRLIALNELPEFKKLSEYLRDLRRRLPSRRLPSR